MRSRKSRSSLHGNINITPFTDVILVLLIVFMISAPGMILSSFKIQLPGSIGQSQHESYSFTVGLDRQGQLYVNGVATQKADLENQIKQLKESSRQRILLNADSQTPYGTVVEVIDLMKKAGAQTVFAGTNPSAKEK